MQQPAWVKPYQELDLQDVRLSGVWREPGGRKAIEDEARRRSIGLRHITPAYTGWGRVHVFLLGRGRRPNTVLLSAERVGVPPVEVELEASSTNYRYVTPFRDLDRLLRQIEQDYPADSLPGRVCTAVVAGVLTWAEPTKNAHVHAALLEENLLAPLRSFLDVAGDRPHTRTVGVELDAADALLAERGRRPGWCPDVRMAVAVLQAMLQRVRRARTAMRPGDVDVRVRRRDLDEAVAAASHRIRHITDPYAESMLLTLSDVGQYTDDDLQPMIYRKRDDL